MYQGFKLDINFSQTCTNLQSSSVNSSIFLFQLSPNFRKIQTWFCFSHKQSPFKELCLLKYPSDIHTFLKKQYCHNVMNQTSVCLHINNCCVFVQSPVFKGFNNFKLVEVSYFCFHIHLHTYTVVLKTLTALQSTIHDGLNKILIPKSMK